MDSPPLLSVLIDDAGAADGPCQLGWYPPLTPPGPGGRPAGDVFGDTVEGFLSRVGPAIVALRAKGEHPTIEAVAELADLSVDMAKRGRRRYGFPDWDSAVRTVIRQEKCD